MTPTERVDARRRPILPEAREAVSALLARELDIYAILEPIPRWQYKGEGPNPIEGLRENVAEHTRGARGVGNFLIPLLGDSIEPEVVHAMILVHDIGERDVGDVLALDKAKMTAEEVIKLKTQERKSVVRTIEDLQLPPITLHLWDLFEGWKNNQNPLPVESVLAQISDKLHTHLTYLNFTVDREGKGGMSEQDVSREVANPIFLGELFRRLARFSHVHDNPDQVRALIERVTQIIAEAYLLPEDYRRTFAIPVDSQLFRSSPNGQNGPGDQKRD